MGTVIGRTQMMKFHYVSITVIGTIFSVIFALVWY